MTAEDRASVIPSSSTTFREWLLAALAALMSLGTIVTLYVTLNSGAAVTANEIAGHERRLASLEATNGQQSTIVTASLASIQSEVAALRATVEALRSTMERVQNRADNVQLGRGK
jgi:uncharacterized coiled-coil protein SlyX